MYLVAKIFLADAGSSLSVLAKENHAYEKNKCLYTQSVSLSNRYDNIILKTIFDKPSRFYFKI